MGDPTSPGGKEAAHDRSRRQWDERARTIVDSFELVRGEPVARHADWVLDSHSNELRRLIGDVDGLRLLDVGCGAGATLATLPEASVRAGFDLSMGMLRRSAPAPTASRPVLFVNASADFLPAVDASYDCTLCLDMLQYLDDASTRRALSELVRVTKPGGRLILYVRNSHSPIALTRQAAGIVRGVLRRPRSGVEYYRSPRWYEAALAGQAALQETYAYGLHPVGIGPLRLLRLGEEVEELAQRALFGRLRFGVHQFMRFHIDRD